MSLASTLFCFISQTRPQQKRYQPVLPLCGFALRSMTCRQPLVPPTNPHSHTPPASSVRSTCRKWVRKWVRKHARKLETCVCVVFRAFPNICGGVCGAFCGFLLDSLCSAHVWTCQHTFEETPQHEQNYSMGGNCMNKWEVHKRTIMQLSFCTTSWLPRVNGLRELCIRSLVGH